MSDYDDIVDPQTVEWIARSFWRRIYPFRNDYHRELPEKIPVAFLANMTTALIHIKQSDANKQIQSLTAENERLMKLREGCVLLIQQYEAEDNYTMGGKLTNKPFLMIKEAIEELDNG